MGMSPKEKVLQMLAQAESTTHLGECQAFLAKAIELIKRDLTDRPPPPAAPPKFGTKATTSNSATAAAAAATRRPNPFRPQPPPYSTVPPTPPRPYTATTVRQPGPGKTPQQVIQDEIDRIMAEQKAAQRAGQAPQPHITVPTSGPASKAQSFFANNSGTSGIIAKYNGRCAECGQAIVAGQSQITQDPYSQKYVHIECM